MSESDNTKELDNYGVWVKKPPRTVSSDETLSNEIAPSGTEIKNADTGDNKMEDIDIDSFMDGADFSDSSSGESAPAPEKKTTSPDGTEEVSLDEFLDGGVFESDDGGSAASEKSEQESKSLKQAENQPAPAVSENDFSASNDITVTDSNPASSSDDSPLDIDLSFDDAPADSSSQGSSEPQFETIDSPASSSSGLTANSSSGSDDGTENVDLSEFGFDIDAPESSADEKPAVPETKEEPAPAETNSDGTENVDLSEFGFDINAPEPSADEKPAASETKTEEAPAAKSEQENADKTQDHKVDENGMEEVSLDDFDFDINAEEGASNSAEEPQKAEEPKLEAEIPAETKNEDTDDIKLDTSAKNPVEDSDLDSLSLDASSDASPAPELPESDGIEMNVKADDDMEIAPETSNEEDPDKNFKIDDDDFDLDSIMDSIEDENGGKVSLASKDDVVKDIDDVTIEEPKTTPENIDDLNLNSAPADEIPDSFDEETASLFADEPKSEEDSDKTVAETTEPAPTDVVEQSEPVFEETSVDLSELPDEIPEIPEDEQKTENKETQTAQASNSDNNIEETSNPFTLPPDDAFVPSKEENSKENENSADEKIAAATAGKDDEIASSTNTILSQIVSELASLKSEISGLKNEFDELKAKESSAQETPAKASDEENTGFFSGNEDDDTIALSVDELDNILNSAEMVNDDDKESDSSDKINEEPAETKNESSELEENISDNSDDLLPDYTDDDAEGTQKDIFIPKAEEIEEAQSQIDFGNTDESENSEPESDKAAENSSDSAANDDDFSIGDFSFDDDSGNTKSEAADEIQPAEELSDEMVQSIESSNSITSDNSAANDIPASDEKSEDSDSTVDEPFEFGQTPSADEEFKEPVPQDEENTTEPASEPKDAENDNISISNEELNNLLAPDPTIEESLTDENLNYLAADKGIDGNETETTDETSSIPGNLKKEIKSVLSYMDQLLENLPEDKIAEFAQSEQFETYKKLFKELGLDKQ